MFFASDNGAACPPQVIEAMLRANAAPPAMPYGNDPGTARAQAMIREVLEAPQAVVHFVGSGTAANALALASLTPPWGAIFCHPLAHIQNDECGAPEFYSQAKLITVEGANGRIDPGALDAAIRAFRPGNVHTVQPGAVSITSLTESGTLYAPDEIAVIAEVAQMHRLPLHLDGARFANALAASGASPAELTWKAGVDVLSFGGAKGGLMNAEAVVFFNPDLASEFELRRKRGGHLSSKMRYLAAQFEGWLPDGLWLDLARHANAMGARLAAGLAALPGVTLEFEVAGNIVFARMPEAMHARLRAAGATYYGDASAAARMVTSWATTAAEVDEFLRHAAG